jgi:23S rRNA maturation-related 3'-5' exoribonuclease YhaM
MFQKDVYIRQKELKKSKNGKEYLKLELCFDNKRLFSYLWKNSSRLYEEIHFSHAAHIKGELFMKNNREQLNITEIILYSKQSKDAQAIKIDPKLLNWAKEIIESFSKKPYQELSKSFITKQYLLDLIYYPAGKLLVFNEEGGLFKRTSELIRLVDSISYLEFDTELVKLATIGQAYGFINGIYYNNVFEYNDDAKFLGIGKIALSESYEFIKKSALSSANKSHLKHLISLVYKPDTDFIGLSKEAEILIQLQKLLYSYLAFSSIEKKEENKTRKWSNYNQLFKRHIFFTKE